MVPLPTRADISPWTTPWTLASTTPLMRPRTRPFTYTVPAVRWAGTGAFSLKLVFSTMISPTSRIWGRMNMTRNMEIRVPRLMHSPMPTMAASVDILPMRKAAELRMVPEVNTVGKARFRALTMAVLGGKLAFISVYRVEMTMA